MRGLPRPIGFHPLVFAAYPALYLLATNIGQIPSVTGMRIIIASVLLGALAYAAAVLVMRHWDRAALAASLVVVVLLSYGRLYDGLKALGLSGETLVRHRYLLPACVVLVGAGVGWCARRKETATLNRALNVMSVVALAFPVVGIAAYQGNALRNVRSTEDDCTLRPPARQPLPDVYLIIMDAYERGDMMREFHGYDNSPFLTSLEAMGFIVAQGSMSNYRQTEMSLSSMLNMEYVQDFPGRFGSLPNSQWDVIQLINHSRVRHELECLGYVTVAFETGLFWTEWDDADYYLQRQAGAHSGLGLSGKVSRIEYLYLETTAGRALTDSWTIALGASPPEVLDPNVDHRDRILFVFDRLPGVARLPSPKLVFVHIISPHPPFLFGPNGEPVSHGDFETGFPGTAMGSPLLQAYADQVNYLNKRLLESIGAILNGSKVPPAIVLMGDHGWAYGDSENSMSNLNAYLVPDSTPIYPTITPVNTFRLIFDGDFGGEFGRLPDVSYISSYHDKFNLTVVPNTWRPSNP